MRLAWRHGWLRMAMPMWFWRAAVKKPQASWVSVASQQCKRYQRATMHPPKPVVHLTKTVMVLCWVMVQACWWWKALPTPKHAVRRFWQSLSALAWVMMPVISPRHRKMAKVLLWRCVTPWVMLALPPATLATSIPMAPVPQQVMWQRAVRLRVSLVRIWW